MNLMEMGLAVDEALSALEREEPDPARRDAFSRARAEAKDVVRRLAQSGRSPHGTYMEPLPHPHPRSRVYRAQPWDWNISDTRAQDVKGKMRARRERLGTGSTPVVVFDLDGTLFDVGPRTLGILQRWLKGADALKHPEALRARAEMIGMNHIGYSLMHAFENAGFDLRNEEVAGLVVAAEREWRKRFFDGKTLAEFDVPVSGAPEFARWCKDDLGLRLVYLSGRYERVMSEGTRAQLLRYGFPWEGTELRLKPDNLMDDSEFKQRAFAEVASRHGIVANFENEYVNLALMAACEPDAVHVILDSQHSGRFVPQCQADVLRLLTFEG